MALPNMSSEQSMMMILAWIVHLPEYRSVEYLIRLSLLSSLFFFWKPFFVPFVPFVLTEGPAPLRSPGS